MRMRLPCTEHRRPAALHLAFATLLLMLSLAPAQATACTSIAVLLQASGNPNDQMSPGQQLVNETREAAGENKDEFKHSSSVLWISKLTGLSLHEAYWLSTLINFGVIAGVIFWLSKKNLPALFRQRNAFIEKAMEEARKTSEEANRRLKEIEVRLSKLDAEIAEMRSAAEKEAAEEERRIKAAAAEDARRIIESVEQEIAAMAKTTRRELTAYAANLAVSLAKKQIQVDAATDQALVRGFAQQLSNGDDGRKQ